MHLQCLFVIVVLFCASVSVDSRKDLLLDEYGSQGTKAQFYDEEFLQGTSTFLETKGPCKNLPGKWPNKARSVDTRGSCVSVCDGKDCSGYCTRLYAGRGEQQLSTVKMDRKVVSLKSCFV